MEAIRLWLEQNFFGELLYTALMAMAPVVELRGAIPFGYNVLGLNIWLAAAASVVGNLLPVPFIIIYVRRVFAFLRRKIPKLNRMVDRLVRKAEGKRETVNKYGFWGLCILVAIPLPGTGAWTGAMVAAFMDMRIKKAFPAIALGVVIAGIIVTFLTAGVTAILI